MNTKFSNEGYLFETAISNRTLNSVVCDLCISLSNRVNMHTRFLEKIGSASDILDEVARTKPNALIIATSANGYFGQLDIPMNLSTVLSLTTIALAFIVNI